MPGQDAGIVAPNVVVLDRAKRRQGKLLGKVSRIFTGVVSGSKDATIRIWDTEMGAEICEPLRGMAPPPLCRLISRLGEHNDLVV